MIISSKFIFSTQIKFAFFFFSSTSENLKALSVKGSRKKNRCTNRNENLFKGQFKSTLTVSIKSLSPRDWQLSHARRAK